MTCETCDGSGKVDSKDGLPWNRYLSEENAHATPYYKSIQAGEVTPVNCPDCKGSGQAAEKEKT